jgi:alginate O-acetyltransferase complex protein AlgI
MLVSGIWHGAGWTFVLWGGMYGVLIVVYQALGMGGAWKPRNKITTFLAWLVMFIFIVFGWLLFGAPSLAWVAGVFTNPLIGSREHVLVAFLALAMTTAYSLPLILKMLMDRYLKHTSIFHAIFYVVATIVTIVFMNSSSPDFIYFQF